jgi:peptidoglycan/LPS O-acetylase OafA/YrhL
MADHPTSAQRLTFISAIRGVAALLVVLFHLQIHVFAGFPNRPIAPHSSTWWLFLGFFDLGKFAVALFFMVSGFLIPATLRRSGATLPEFAWHRFLRLYPAYWASIALALACWYGSGRADLPTPATVIANVTMFQRFLGQPDLVGVYWTLQIELVFYITCAVLGAAGLLRLNGAWIASALALAAAVAAGRAISGVALPVAIPLALAVMFLGDRLRLHGRRAFDRALVRDILATGLGLAAVCLVGYGADGPRYVLCYWSAIAVFGACWRYAGAFDAAHWCAGVAGFLGDVSYSAYLTGATITGVLAAPVYAATGSRVLTAVAVVATTLLLSLAAFRYIESPGIRLGRLLGGRARADSGRLAAPE